MININKLIYYYENRVVLDNLDLEWNAGEIIMLSGKSGVGKSTLARIIAGFEKPNSGTVKIDGNLVSSKNIMIPPYQRNIGMVFQRSTLWPHMNVQQNIEFVLKCSKKTDTGLVEGLMQASDLNEISSRYPNDLSGGQVRKVEIVRALAARSKYIIMDEPFNNLDSVSKEQMMELVKKEILYNKSGLLLITHDHSEMSDFNGKRIFMDNGKIIDIYTEEEKQ